MSDTREPSATSNRLPRGRLADAGVVVYSTDQTARHQLREMLVSLGFSNIKLCGRLNDISDVLLSNTIDLFVLDLRPEESGVAAYIRQLRHGGHGRNPYAVIVCTCWQSSRNLVRAVMLSGADDLLVRPFSTIQLGERIRAHVEARKKFVVTSDYIGPDRRSAAEAARTDIQGIDVPNSLKVRTVGTEEEIAALDAQIAEIDQQINLRKIRRHAMRVSVLGRFIRENYGGGPPASRTGLDADIRKLVGIADDVAQRIEGTPYAHVSKLCTTLKKVAGDIARDLKGQNSARNLKLLEEVAIAIQVAFNPDLDQGKLAEDIARTVDTTRPHRGGEGE